MHNGRSNLSRHGAACLLAYSLCLTSPVLAAPMVSVDGQTLTNVNFTYPDIAFDYVDDAGATQRFEGNAVQFMAEPALRVWLSSLPEAHPVHPSIRRLAGLYQGPHFLDFMAMLEADGFRPQGNTPGTSGCGSVYRQYRLENGNLGWASIYEIDCVKSQPAAFASGEGFAVTVATEMQYFTPKGCTQFSVATERSNFRGYYWFNFPMRDPGPDDTLLIGTQYRHGLHCTAYDGNFSAYIGSLGGGSNSYGQLFTINCVGNEIDGRNCSAPGLDAVFAHLVAGVDYASDNPPAIWGTIDLGLEPGAGGGGDPVDPGEGGEDPGEGDTGGGSTGGGSTGGGSTGGGSTGGGSTGGDTGGGDTGGSGGSGDGSGGGSTGGGSTGGSGGSGDGSGGTGGDTGGTGEGSGFGDAPEIEVTEIAVGLFSYGSGWLPRSCPAPLSLNLLGRSHTLSFAPACEGLEYLSFVLLALALLKATSIVLSSRQV